MKPPFQALLVPALVFCLCPIAGQASEMRVDTAGGLTSVITDETTDLDLFMDGNPAALVLLPHTDRFDLPLQWAYSTSQPAVPGSTTQAFTTLPRLGDTVLAYQGLMVFPDSNWAFQIIGNFLSGQGNLIFKSLDTYTSSQYDGVLRAATNLGPVALGLEIENTETDEDFDPGLFNANLGLQSGNNAQNQTFVKAGLITDLSGDRTPKDSLWQVGGVFRAQVGSSPQNENLDLFYLNTNAFTVNRVYTTTDDYTFGPEIRYEVPERVILRFSYFATYSDEDYRQTVPPGTPILSTNPDHYFNQFQTMTALGNFRFTFPLSEQENLKIGGSLGSTFNNTDLLHADQNVYYNENKQQINAIVGVGVEAPRDYMVGLQFKTVDYFYGANYTNPDPTEFNEVTDYSLFQLALGGEKWLTPHFAFRGGFIAEEDIDAQDTTSRTLTTTVVAGFGCSQEKWTLDFKVSAGEGFEIDGSGTSFVAGAGLTGTLFL
jgi:hypothetical protein